ncbi:unnamed protein product [Ixodes persulcatus]
MSIVKTALLVVLGVVCVSSAFPGIWRKHHPDVDPRYKEWAHFVISSQVENRTNFDTLMTLMSVESQVMCPQDVDSFLCLLYRPTCRSEANFYSTRYIFGVFLFFAALHALHRRGQLHALGNQPEVIRLQRSCLRCEVS